MARPTKNKALRRQQLWVVVAALLIIALSVSSTLYFTGFLGGGDSAEGSGGYRNITFTDAYLECDDYTRERYAPRLQTLTLDNHSSRFDTKDEVFKIFMQLQMRRPPREPLPQPYWVNCFVSAGSGRITHYQVGEDKNAPVQAVKREPGGALGWPMGRP